ncbi:RNA-binding protein [Candidatus Woesearchaeota archaeon]|nr:RNA-binding protein [Candidatus Woesearchaeota archaeon]
MKIQLSNSEVKELIKSLETNYLLKEVINKKDIVIKEENLLKVNNKVLFFFYKEDKVEKLTPTLKLVLELGERIKGTTIKTIIVDKGAVKFVVNGADIMRPGITKIDEGIQKGEIVVILEETHKKPISICVSEASSEELKAMTHGKALKNIHFVGDSVWKSS